MQEIGNLVRLTNGKFLNNSFKILNFKGLNFNINNIFFGKKEILEDDVKKSKEFKHIKIKNNINFISNMNSLNFSKNEKIDSINNHIYKIDYKMSKKDLENIIKMLKCSIKDSNNELFKNIYNIYKHYFYENNFNISKLNFDFVKTAYFFGKKDAINYIDFTSINNNDFKNLFKELISMDVANPEFLNIILSKRPNIITNFPTIIDKKNTIRELQGDNQTKFIQRKISYSKEFKIKNIYDTYYTNLKNNENNRLLYNIKYTDNNTKEITYYKRDGKSILASVRINNNKLNILNIGSYEEDEINEILNDNYVSMHEFDEKLSILSYTLLKDEKNIIIKTNCKSIEDIVNNIKENIALKKQDKIFICDFSIDNHNVQVVIGNKNVIILNTGLDFNKIKNEIESSCRQKNLDVKVKHIKTINQSEGNCVEASKLSTVTFIKGCKNNPIKFLEILNDFGEFQNKIFKCKKCEKRVNCIKNKEIFNKHKPSLDFISEINNQLLKKSKHFVDIYEDFIDLHNNRKNNEKESTKPKFDISKRITLCIDDFNADIMKNSIVKVE